MSTALPSLLKFFFYHMGHPCGWGQQFISLPLMLNSKIIRKNWRIFPILKIHIWRNSSRNVLTKCSLILHKTRTTDAAPKQPMEPWWPSPQILTFGTLAMHQSNDDVFSVLFCGGAEEFKKFYTFFKQCELGSYQGLVRSSVHLLQRRCLPPWDTRVAHKQRINFRLRLDLATSDLFQCLRRLRLIPNWVLCNWFWFKIIITIPCQSFYSTNSSIEQSEDVRKLDAPSASNAALGRMAGNGMHLASAAFTALVSMICLTDKWFWFPLKTCMVPQRSVGVLWIHATCNDAIVYG